MNKLKVKCNTIDEYHNVQRYFNKIGYIWNDGDIFIPWENVSASGLRLPVVIQNYDINSNGVLINFGKLLICELRNNVDDGCELLSAVIFLRRYKLDKLSILSNL